jgi:hypothetical protein
MSNTSQAMTLKLTHPAREIRQHVLAALLLAALACWLAVPALAQGPPKDLPNFKFYDLQGKPFARANLKAGLTTFIFFFSPDCDHCNQEAAWIAAELPQFKGSQFVFVTWEDNAATIEAFRKKYFDKPGAPPMTFVKDLDFNIDNFFGPSEVPCIYVYDHNNKFVKAFRQETKAKDLYSLIK